MEWILLLALTFPIPTVTIVGCFVGVGCGGQYSLGSALLEVTMVGAFATALSIGVDRIRPSLTSDAVPLKEELQRKLADAMSSTSMPLSEAWPGRARMLANDLSMGAHVRGVIRPYIVMSGGLVVGLLRQDPRAISILAHEASHIAHLDQLLPGLLGLTAFESIGRLVRAAVERPDEGLSRFQFIAFYTTVFGFIGLMAFVASKVSKYREFYADAAASTAVQSSSDYERLLEQLTGKEASRSGYFHPSPEDRLSQLRLGYSVLRRGRFWKVFFLATLLISWYQWWMTRLLAEELGTHMERFAASTMTISIVGLLFEATRRFWAPPASSSRVPSTGKSKAT